MMPFMVQVGANMIPTGAFTFSVHLEPSAALGSNSQIPLVEATLILNPPRMYSLLLATANPPGRTLPGLPGQLSAALSTVWVSVAGSYEKTRDAATVSPTAEPAAQ